MKDSGSISPKRWAISEPAHHSEGKVQYLLNSEPQILQSIFVRTPVRQILHEICNALDCEIANIVSLIALPGLDGASALDTPPRATLFGLYDFFSAAIVAEDGETLGTLEMYCCYAQCEPSPRQLQVIERAACLAAIAFERDRSARPAELDDSDNWPARRRVVEWPVSVN